MTVAVIGSRSIRMRVDAFIPIDADAIVTGGAQGVDRAAEQYARRKGIPCTVLKPDYERFGRRAPLVRDQEIVLQADMVVAIWDGASRGTAFSLKYAEQLGKEVRVYIVEGS